MELKEIIEKAKQGLVELTKFSASAIVGGVKKEDGWHVRVELVERKAIPDTQDLLGVYDVVLDDEGNFVSFERKRVRRRMDVEEYVPD